MTKQKNFEIYLCIENDRFKIFLLDTYSFKNLYMNEYFINNTFVIDFDKLSKFLDENIFKIEKLSNKFIEDIFLIIDNNKELQTSISIKKKNNDDIPYQKNLNQTLIELKDLFKENNKDQYIMHMLIENFIINGKNYKTFVDKVEPDVLSIDYEVKPREISKNISIPIQGGFNPNVLLTNTDEIKKEALKYINIFKEHPYIFNLGHGVLPQTDPNMVEYLVNFVKNN